MFSRFGGSFAAHVLVGASLELVILFFGLNGFFVVLFEGCVLVLGFLVFDLLHLML